MKHILPVLTVTALAAAASAQTAPAPAAKQSLSYNRVVASWVNVTGVVGTGAGSLNGVSVKAQAKIGSGFYVSATAMDLEGQTCDNTAASLGYAYALPTVLGVTSDLNVELGYKSLGAGLRLLVGGGLELGISYTHGAGAMNVDGIYDGGDVGSNFDTVGYSLSYNLGFLVKGLSLNASYASQSGDYAPVNGVVGLGPVGADVTSIGIGYNF